MRREARFWIRREYTLPKRHLSDAQLDKAVDGFWQEFDEFVKEDKTDPADFFHTVDDFVTEVPWGKWRSVLVYRRRHGARTYVRFRTWNLHRTKQVWYPSKRFFVVPIERAEALADALYQAVSGECSDKPAWLVAREDEEERNIGELQELGVHHDVITQARIRLDRKQIGQH